LSDESAAPFDGIFVTPVLVQGLDRARRCVVGQLVLCEASTTTLKASMRAFRARLDHTPASSTIPP
jgi:hypothetical protein